MAWAPGKGTKGKEFKEFWEVDVGSSYIPWDRLPPNIDLDPFEEGGMIDEESLPTHLMEQRKRKMIEKIEKEKADQLLKEQQIAAEKLKAEAEELKAAQAAAMLAQIPTPAPIVASTVPTGGVLPPPSMLPTGPPPPLIIPPLNPALGLPPNPMVPPPVMPGTLAPSLPPPGAIPLDQFKNMVSYPIQHALDKLKPPPSAPPPVPQPMTSHLPPPAAPGHLGMGAPPPALPMFSTAPMAMPPHQVLSGRPPPPLPWGSRPPSTGPPSSTLTGSNSQPLGFPKRPPMISPSNIVVPPLAPHLRPAVPPPDSSMSMPPRNMPPGPRDMPERSSNDDPFAPSMYELKNMNRGRPAPPFPMPGGRPALLGRYEDNNFGNRNRFSEDGMRGGPRNTWNDGPRNDWTRPRHQNHDHFRADRGHGSNWHRNSDPSPDARNDFHHRSDEPKSDDSMDQNDTPLDQDESSDPVDEPPVAVNSEDDDA